MPWTGTDSAGWGWFREYQRRGVVHYHVVLEEGLLASAFGGEPLSSFRVGRGKQAREVVRGRHEYWIVSRWIEAVGDHDVRFEAFQWGGIVELLRDVDSPSRYLGAYASKAAQKKLPKGELPGGRWWWCSPKIKIVPCGTFTLWDWPLEYPCSMLWDYRILDRDSNSSLPEE